MRVAPQKQPRQERHTQKRERQAQAKRLAVRTIDQMHDRHGWLPTGETCGSCKHFRTRFCYAFYGKKIPPVDQRIPWKAKYIACGLFAMENEPAFRTVVRQANAVAAGELAPPPAQQQRLFR